MTAHDRDLRIVRGHRPRLHQRLCGAGNIEYLNVETESERNLAWSADRSRVRLNYEFLIQNILHIEEQVRTLVYLS